MFVASATFSKCLVWLAAVLSPMQALQGTHIVCSHNVSDHLVEELPELRSCCGSVKVRGESESNSDTFNKHNPSSPCSCPPDCWCRRLSQAQLPGQPLVETRHSFETLGYWVDVTSITSSSHFAAQVKVDTASAISTAQQLCAILCRFLA